MEITQDGLESNILNDLSEVLVGGLECELVYSMSIGCETDNSKVCCRVPAFQTIRTLADFTIAEE